VLSTEVRDPACRSRGCSVHSPRVQFRLPEQLRTQAEQVAEDESVSLAALARHALKDYLRSRTS
jgi:predicted HicB family RNase H-like nuclease